jgi:hypothetical protein
MYKVLVYSEDLFSTAWRFDFAQVGRKRLHGYPSLHWYNELAELLLDSRSDDYYVDYR